MPTTLAQSKSGIWINVAISAFFGTAFLGGGGYLISVGLASDESRSAAGLGGMLVLIAAAALGHAIKMLRRLGKSLAGTADELVFDGRKLPWSTLKSVTVHEQRHTDDDGRESWSYQGTLYFHDAEIQADDLTAGYVDLLEHACAELEARNLPLDARSRDAYTKLVQRESEGRLPRARVLGP